MQGSSALLWENTLRLLKCVCVCVCMCMVIVYASAEQPACVLSEACSLSGCLLYCCCCCCCGCSEYSICVLSAQLHQRWLTNFSFPVFRRCSKRSLARAHALQTRDLSFIRVPPHVWTIFHRHTKNAHCSARRACRANKHTTVSGWWARLKSGPAIERKTASARVRVPICVQIC